MNMIQKLRWKFVAINMLIVSALLFCICVTIIVTTQDGLRQDSLSLLNRVIAQETMPSWPYSSRHSSSYDYDYYQDSEDSGLIAIFGGLVEDQAVSLPYFTVFVTPSGLATIMDSQFYDLSDEDTLTAVVTDCLMQPADSGILEDYSLRYLRTTTAAGWRMAFSDISQERSTLRQMTINLLAMAALALVVLFFISHLLAHWATAPVERTLKQQRQFIADASHELKTPLTVVLSNVEMLQSYSQKLSEKDQRWLENIRCSSQQMQSLVEDMLILARSDSLSQNHHPQEPVNLSDLVMDAVLFFEPTVFEAGKVLEDDIDDDLYVSGDAAKLKRLVVILLDNAQKYARPHGRIRICLKPDGSKRVCLSVFNEGEPMSREQLSHIFERFYRGDKARSTEGFGLGLSIAERTVTEHHGTIHAESDDRGNTFLVSLPRGKEHKSATERDG